MFEVNAQVMYGRTGACQVKEITNGDLFGKPEAKFYILMPLFSNGMSIITPVDEPKVAMRELMTRQEVLDLIDAMKDQEPVWEYDEKVRNAQFSAAMTSGLCDALLTVIHLISKNNEEMSANGRKLSQNDASILKDAKKLLYEEFALSLAIRPDQVEAFIASRQAQQSRKVS
jgi:CarD family transcriptional regulator